MKALRNCRCLLLCLASALAGCAHEAPRGQIHSGSANHGADGGPINLVIDGQSYSGFASRIPSNDSSIYVYQAMLRAPDGRGLRCNLTRDGRHRTRGTCIDDNQRVFDVLLGN